MSNLSILEIEARAKVYFDKINLYLENFDWTKNEEANIKAILGKEDSWQLLNYHSMSEIKKSVFAKLSNRNYTIREACQASTFGFKPNAYIRRSDD